MGEELSAEQVREKHLRDMGPELGAVYNALDRDVAWLHAKWNQYRQLYARSPERIALLNQVAGHFFGVVQDTLFEDVLLHLARLTDPAKSVGNENLTLKRLVGDTESGPKSDILGQASAGIRMDHCLEFPV